MRSLTTVYCSMLCALGIAACAVDEPAEATQPQAVVTDGAEVRTIPDELSFSKLHPNDSAHFDIIFADGCHINFACHADVVGGRPAFCTESSCNGSGNAHASAFCSNNCSAGTNCASGNITNLGSC